MEVALQLKKGILYPHSIEDQEKIKDLKENQIVKAKITGVRKPRSLQQLRLYWKLCKEVSENTERPEFSTYRLVDWRLRNSLQFYDTDYTYVTPNGQVNFKVKSISFKNLKHIEACGYFDRAFDLMAKALGVELDVLVGEGNR